MTPKEQELRNALIDIRTHLKSRPDYEALTEDQEIEVGGDTAEFSYLVRIADAALGDQ